MLDPDALGDLLDDLRELFGAFRELLDDLRERDFVACGLLALRGLLGDFRELAGLLALLELRGFAVLDLRLLVDDLGDDPFELDRGFFEPCARLDFSLVWAIVPLLCWSLPGLYPFDLQAIKHPDPTIADCKRVCGG